MPSKGEEETAWDDSGQATPAVVDDDMARLRQENAKLREELAAARQGRDGAGDAAAAAAEGGAAEGGAGGEWPTEIVYDQLSVPAGKVLSQLSGISKQRMREGRIRNAAELDYLPKPSSDEAQLQADYVRWGYCCASPVQR